jgi:ABC-type dipeptide/oligopeptide/nickel transport system ATPase subunit
MLAFYEIIANSNPNNLQFILLDEVLDGLDEVTIEQVVPLLKEFAETYDVQLLFISNISVNKNYFDGLLTSKEASFLIQRPLRQ